MTMPAPDAEWLALVANPGRPSIGPGVALPLNEIADALMRPAAEAFHIAYDDPSWRRP